MIARYIFVLFLLPSFAQATTKYSHNLFECALSGYIKGETYTDSRETVADEDDEIAYFPRRQIDDPTGHDINARGSTRMDAFETRICGTLSGLKMREATISGCIEVDFEIFFTPVTNAPHMRHAYGRLDWKKFNFIFGQTWHPVVLEEPKTINYNGPSPFDFYARSPQFSCTYNATENFKVIAVAASQTTDFMSDGPYGPSTNYIRWGKIPNLHIKLQHVLRDHIMSIGVDYKRIVPRLESDTGYKVNEHLDSFAAVWCLALKWPSLTISTKVNWGQNVTDYTAIEGYAVKRGSINPITHEQSYTNTSNIAAYIDIEVIKNKKIKPGLFIGFAQNLGSTQEIEFDVVDAQGTIIKRNIFGFRPNLKNVFRISSRVSSEINTVTFAGEVEYTRAAYGTINRMARVINTTPAELVRCTLGIYYYF